MTAYRVWLASDAVAPSDLASQRYVVNRLLNAGILADDIAGSLRQTAHVLAAVEDSVRLVSDS